jgi:hypothetical protein
MTEIGSEIPDLVPSLTETTKDRADSPQTTQMTQIPSGHSIPL